MLSIQHINNRIKNSEFFQKIDEGLSFDDFKIDDAIKARFKNGVYLIYVFVYYLVFRQLLSVYPELITTFACPTLFPVGSHSGINAPKLRAKRRN